MTMRPDRDQRRPLPLTPTYCLESAFERTPDHVSVVTFNVLSDRYTLRQGQLERKFEHCAEHMPWKKRFGQMQRNFRQMRADIFCLQEVQYDHFDECFLPFFHSMGYDGVIQRRKKGDDTIVGVATFFNVARFTLLETAHRSRTMVTTFLWKDPPQADAVSGDTTAHCTCKDAEAPAMNHLIVANVHLQAKASKTRERCCQLRSLLGLLEKTYDETYFHGHSAADTSAAQKPQPHFIVCGDFNGGPSSAPLSIALRNTRKLRDARKSVTATTPLATATESGNPKEKAETLSPSQRKRKHKKNKSKRRARGDWKEAHVTRSRKGQPPPPEIVDEFIPTAMSATTMASSFSFPTTSSSSASSSSSSSSSVTSSPSRTPRHSPPVSDDEDAQGSATTSTNTTTTTTDKGAFSIAEADLTVVAAETFSFDVARDDAEVNARKETSTMHGLIAESVHRVVLHTAMEGVTHPSYIDDGFQAQLDHLLHSPSLEPLILMHPCGQHAAVAYKKFTPNEVHPSDHCPVGAVFLRTRTTTGDTPRPNVLPPPPPAPADPFEGTTPPDDVIAAWKTLLREQPPRPKGKPSVEELVALREHASKKKAFLNDFPKAHASYLKKLTITSPPSPPPPPPPQPPLSE